MNTNNLIPDISLPFLYFCTHSFFKTIVFSSSLDGTVRAYDLIRYRNYRTLTPPQPVPLITLALDPSSEIAVAGSSETFDIYVWYRQYLISSPTFYAIYLRMSASKRMLPKNTNCSASSAFWRTHFLTDIPLFVLVLLRIYLHTLTLYSS